MPSIVRHVALTLTATLALSACAKSEAPPTAGGEMEKKEAAAPAGETTTATGLKYAVITSGSGKSPGPSDTVTVHYRGTLTDGSEFDSSYKRGQPAKFPVNRVIPGWTEALQLMKEGDKWKLTIPPNLAYGSQGAGAADVAAAFNADGLGALVNNSRGINFAYAKEPYASQFGEENWQEAAFAATEQMIADLAEHTSAGNLRG